jgi:putative transcriptional regulator
MTPSKGILLIADPFLKDPHFMRTVVFICEHQEGGTFGFILNKACEYTLDELVTGTEGLKIPVYSGGPVQRDTIHILHQYPDQMGGIRVLNGVYWGGDFEKAIELIRTGEVKEENIRFFIGYSGWGEGQLDEELKEKTWLTSEATKNILFHQPALETWKEALRMMGGEYKTLINYPIDPSLN